MAPFHVTRGRKRETERKKETDAAMGALYSDGGNGNRGVSKCRFKCNTASNARGGRRGARESEQDKDREDVSV